MTTHSVAPSAFPVSRLPSLPLRSGYDLVARRVGRGLKNMTID